MNFQTFKLDLEKAEIKSPTSVGLSKKRVPKKKREFQRNIYFCFIDYTKAFDFVDHSKLENSERDGNTNHLNCLLRNLLVKKQQ